VHIAAVITENIPTLQGDISDFLCKDLLLVVIYILFHSEDILKGGKIREVLSTWDQQTASS